MPFGQREAPLPVHCVSSWQPFPTSQVCSLWCASTLPGTQVPTQPNRNDTGHAANCTSWNVRKAGGAGVWQTDHAMSDQGGGQSRKGSQRLDWGSVNMKHYDVIQGVALTCSPPPLCQTGFISGHKTESTILQRNMILWLNNCQYYSPFIFPFLQVCLWWAEPSSIQWWVRPGWWRHTPLATPTSWRGWPSLWRWSADSSMSSWESENEPSLHPSVPRNPLPNCKCHQSPSEV